MWKRWRWCRLCVYLIVHGEDDHQFPEDGDEVEEQIHTVPSENRRLLLRTCPFLGRVCSGACIRMSPQIMIVHCNACAHQMKSLSPFSAFSMMSWVSNRTKPHMTSSPRYMCACQKTSCQTNDTFCTRRTQLVKGFACAGTLNSIRDPKNTFTTDIRKSRERPDIRVPERKKQKVHLLFLQCSSVKGIKCTEYLILRVVNVPSSFPPAC